MVEFKFASPLYDVDGMVGAFEVWTIKKPCNKVFGRLGSGQESRRRLLAYVMRACRLFKIIAMNAVR